MKATMKKKMSKKAITISDPVDETLSAEEQKAYDRIPKKMEYVFHPLFEQQDTWVELFGPESLDVSVPIWKPFPEIPGKIKTRDKYKALTREEEQHLFLKYNFARYRLAGLIELQGERFSKLRALSMIQWHEQVMQLREDLVSANMNLVVAMATRSRVGNVEFSEQISEGSMALLRAVDKFDASRGFKFSTYVCRAIFKSFNRLATNTKRYVQRFGKSFEPEMERSNYDEHKHDMIQADLLRDVNEIILTNAAKLTELERSVLRHRFALHGHSRKTLSELGEQLGLSNERIRQIQKKAIAKMQEILNTRYLAA